MRFLLLFLKFLWTWKERPDKGFSALSKVVLFMFLFFFQVIQLCPCQDSGVCLGISTPLFFVKLHTEKIRSILDPKDIKQPRKCPFYQHFRASVLSKGNSLYSSKGKIEYSLFPFPPLFFLCYFPDYFLLITSDIIPWYLPEMPCL